ncbi:MAG: hypothetical protein K2Q34_03290 [Alphaproteobacteria bacterium]|nr:hypothetical protein [Alphaproteobacteria bacterium]
MWVLIIIAFFQIGNAYASAPVDLELLLNRGLQSFIASSESMPNTKVSKTSHNDESFTPSLCDEAGVDENDIWPETPEN